MAGVVVGFDGSADALAALRWATHYARTEGVLTAAHLVWSADHCPSRVRERAAASTAGDLEVAARELLADAAAGCAGSGGRVDVEERVTAGDPATVLLAASGPAGLLVLGRHGSARMRHLLSGSVTAECLHRASVPVAVIQADKLGRSDGPVVVGVDGSPASIEALRWADRYARRRDVALRVVHAWQPAPPLAVGFYTSLAFSALREVAQAVLDTSIETAFGGDERGKIEPVLTTGGAGHGLIEAAANAQLLVVGARGQGGFAQLLVGSTAQQCVHHAPCPTVVIHGEPEKGEL